MISVDRCGARDQCFASGTRSEVTVAVSNLEKGGFLHTDSIMLVFIMACFMALAGNMFLCRFSAVLLTVTVSSSFLKPIPAQWDRAWSRLFFREGVKVLFSGDILTLFT